MLVHNIKILDPFHALKDHYNPNMPQYKRKRSRSRSSKKYNRRSNWSNDYVRTVPYNSGTGYISRFNPFPAVHYCQLRYTHELELSHNAGVIALQKHFYSANSIYKPNATGILGGQPYGHDQYAALYNHYKVLESIITMTPMGPIATTATNNGGAYGITMEDISNIDSSLREVTERKGTTMATFGGRQSGTQGGKLSRKYSVKYYDANERTAAAFGNNPLEQFYFAAWMYPVDSNINVTTKWLITITYNVKMWELRDFGSSSI